MFTKFTVCFIPQNTNLTFQVFGPFVEKKYAESFIKDDIEFGKNLASEKGWGYGRTAVWTDDEGNKSLVLPGYGEWKIMPPTDPIDPDMTNHNNRQ